MNKVNLPYSTKFITNESPGNEQVLLEDMKEYLRLQGFIPSGESPSTSITDFDDEDNLIEDTTTAAVTYLERAANVSLRNNRISFCCRNEAGDYEMPYSGVGYEIVSITNSEGEAVGPDDYEFFGEGLFYMRKPVEDRITVVYDVQPLTGKSIELSIKRMVAYLYEHRGDELNEHEIRQKADSLCSSYTRTSIWG